VPIALLAVAFPEGGTQPFVPSAFYPALAGVLAVTFLLPPRLRMLRAGGALYALAMIAAYLVPSAVGGNADRLGALVAGPVAALALPAGGRLVGRTRMLALLAPALLYWQANAPVADFAASVSDPAVHASYYTPLLDELRALHVGYGGRPTRIEVVPTVDHWEARWVAPRVMLARGWERQLDRLRNPLFYEPRPPTAARYREWLHQQAVAYVALPDAPLDYSAHGEARLLGGEGAGRPSPLAGAVREIWRSRHWRLFAVSDPRPLADPPAALDAVGRDSFAVAVPGPGSYTIRLRFTPYWALVAGRGCVSRSDGGWTEVQARESGRLRVRVEFSLDRVFERGARCR
jgi:hypothetical protein